MKSYLVIFLLSVIPFFGEKTTYVFSKDPIDVVIPCTDKDRDTLELCIQSTRRYVKNVRRIIVVSKEKISDTAEWFDEKKYPFSKESIAQEIFKDNKAKAEEFAHSAKSRVGWIYQQFLKLYAYFVIPNISPNILIVDADVIWMKPIEFQTEKGEPFFTVAYEYHIPYFDHMARLLKGLTRAYPQYSGVAHHMLFQAPILKDLFTQIEEEHHKLEPWRAICRCIDRMQLRGSPFSEYEIYFNFALSRSDQCRARQLSWNNYASLRGLETYRTQEYVYVACHSWRR